MLEFNESLVAFDLEAQDAREVIEILAGKMHAQELVSVEYGAQTWERETIHPTGLPTKPFCIAFPHADADGVSCSALGVAVLRKPVIFQNMADPDEGLDVVLVFMLANRDPEEQIHTLRNLAVLFGQPEKLVELRDQTTLQGVVSWLRRELRLS
ncbi:MAG TPA: PTS sugar transporter subunit IIA [Anaerolineales bacterium]|jgi:PTS system galactitol-specific IIA component|nr:PTS sugar transporter subunit IIA [Anaerolineales bacterium]HRK89649.1 PTS sugar transporter subunit IIA [Anaerolineales bacterium]